MCISLLCWRSACRATWRVYKLCLHSLRSSQCPAPTGLSTNINKRPLSVHHFVCDVPSTFLTSEIIYILSPNLPYIFYCNFFKNIKTYVFRKKNQTRRNKDFRSHIYRNKFNYLYVTNSLSNLLRVF